MLGAKSIFGLLKANLYTIIVPILLAAFVWMAVGVLDNECRKSRDSQSVKIVKRVHIVVGILATVIAGFNIIALHPVGGAMIKNFRNN